MTAIDVSNKTGENSTSELRKNDVFISYSRRDIDFVKQLDAALRKLDRDPWIDWEDIPATADWWQEIERGIEAADTFVFILTPSSIASKVCNQEVEHAVKHHKRLVPVVRDDNLAYD